MLHLTGYGLTLDDLKAFRQWGSATPGHPEVHHTAGRRGHHRPARPGLRQRRRHGHRRALAARPLRRRARATTTPSSSAPTATSRRASATRPPRSPATSASAGSSTSTTTTTSPSTAPPSSRSPTTPASASRPTAGTSSDLGEVANDLDALEAGLRRAMARGRRAVADRPAQPHRLPVARSSPTPQHAHGNPLGDDEIRVTKEILGLPPDETFYVPDDVLAFYRERGPRGPRRARGVGEAPRRVDRRPRASGTPASAGTGLPGLGGRAARRWGVGREGRHPQGAAARASSALARRRARPRRRRRRPHRQHRHRLKGQGVLSRDEPGGRQIHFGVREHGMGGVMNGMALHGGVLPVGGTFLVFSDYMRGAVRLAAISEAQGHLLVHPRLGRPRRGRADPPADRAPRRAAGHARPPRHPPGRRQRDRGGLARRRRPRRARPRWSSAARTCPCSRAPPQRRRRPGRLRAAGRRRAGRPDLVLIGTGSEVSVCVEAAERLARGRDRHPGRVDAVLGAVRRAGRRYQDDVLPPDVPTLAVEAGVIVRLGPLGRRRRAHRPLRRLRAGYEVLERVRASPPRTSSTRARELLDDLS